ncbi:MAG: hypothetical protein R3B47_04030 [Bacteroidia bacterium]
MDCPSEENLIRLKLEPLNEVVKANLTFRAAVWWSIMMGKRVYTKSFPSSVWATNGGKQHTVDSEFIPEDKQILKNGFVVVWGLT